MRAALTGKFLFRLMPLLAVSLYFFISTTAHAELTFNASVGYDFSSGDYGTATTTEIASIPVTISYNTGSWAGSITLEPYISVTGDGTVVPGGGGRGSGRGFSPGPSSSTTTTDGQGDTTVSLGYALFPANPSDAFIEFTGEAKLGTADATKGLGTGENDYSMQVDYYLGNAAVIPFFTAGYTLMGDTATVDYNNIFYATIGAVFRPTETASFSILYDFELATVDGNDDLEQAGIYFDWQNSALWSTSLGFVKGFSNSAPDGGVSIMFSRQL